MFAPWLCVARCCKHLQQRQLSKQLLLTCMPATRDSSEPEITLIHQQPSSLPTVTTGGRPFQRLCDRLRVPLYVLLRRVPHQEAVAHRRILRVRRCARTRGRVGARASAVRLHTRVMGDGSMVHASWLQASCNLARYREARTHTPHTHTLKTDLSASSHALGSAVCPLSRQLALTQPVAIGADVLPHVVEGHVCA